MAAEQTTQERLLGYYDFDPEIVESVARTAQDQNDLTFPELADWYDLSDGPTRHVSLLGIDILKNMQF